MTYRETLDWMFAQLPMYQRQGKMAFKKDLTNIRALCRHLGNPERKFRSVHVAGTNGKGSVSHMIASILQEAGFKTSLYTSPHLKDFRERIRIDGKCIGEKDVVDFIETNKQFLAHQGLSFFEMTVGMAFDYFASEQVDIAVVEVGLGGRLDSTNVLIPEVSVITNIGLDHTQFLGETKPEIAFEKAGIIKENVPVVVGEIDAETLPVFEEIARKVKAPVFKAQDLITTTYETDLKGAYQLKNIRSAVQTIRLLQEKGWEIDHAAVIRGLKHVVRNTALKGRWQVLNEHPKVICDTAHNREGLQLVLQQLKKETYKRLFVVMGVVNDKNLDTILPLFPPEAQYYFCTPDIPRGLPAAELQKNARRFGLKGKIYPSVNEAYNSALKEAGAADLIYVGGSTFVVAELPL